MIELVSFGFERGPRPAVDLLVDCRGLPNPYRVPVLRPLDGRDPRVAGWLFADPMVRLFADRAVRQAGMRAQAGPARIGVACSAGRHRAVAVAEYIAAALDDEDVTVSIRHAGLEDHRSEPGRWPHARPGRRRTPRRLPGTAGRR